MSQSELLGSSDSLRTRGARWVDPKYMGNFDRVRGDVRENAGSSLAHV